MSDPIRYIYVETSTTVLYTLSLHDALPICIYIVYNKCVYWFSCIDLARFKIVQCLMGQQIKDGRPQVTADRKSTRLNSSHRCISYAVFCLKKKKKLEKYSMPTVHHLNNSEG